MNKLLYDKIVEIINKNYKLSRHELFDLINEPKFSHANGLLSLKYNLDSTKSDEIIVKSETFTSIYSNIKRKKMFKSSASNSINWRRLKENSLSLCSKYKEYEVEDYGGDGPKRNIILKSAFSFSEISKLSLIFSCIGQPEKGQWRQGLWKKHFLFDYPDAGLQNIFCSLCCPSCFNFTVTKALGKGTGLKFNSFLDLISYILKSFFLLLLRLCCSNLFVPTCHD